MRSMFFDFNPVFMSLERAEGLNEAIFYWVEVIKGM